MSLLQKAQKFAPQIPIKYLPPVQLEEAALKQFRKENPTEGIKHLSAILVNFIRHQLSPYDKLMDTTRINKNGYELRAILRYAVLMAIAQTYAHMPEIVAEARRQLTKKTDIADPEPNIRAWRAK
jgi:hypothetical protein